MAKKKSLEEVFENFNPEVTRILSLNEDDEGVKIFDDILIVDERYNQSSLINQGGVKKIFKTTDSLTNRPVAKATLLDWSDSWKVENFLREARLTAALEHPNIIPIYDIGIDEEEGPYFIMKLVGGKSLEEILSNLTKPENEKEFTLNALLEIFLKICDAVAFAHSKGIIHLDLKPANIQIDGYGQVLVCDWGLAKVLENPDEINDFGADLDPGIYNDVTLDGIIKGTPGYMAPEQINTNIGPKSKQTDIYALGGILYSLLCLKKPYESDTLEGLMKKTLKGKLLLPSERKKDGNIPSSLEAVAMKALEVEPEDRYASVKELRQEINKWMEGFATEAENASFIKSAWLLLNRHKIVSLLLFLLSVSVILAFYFVKENEHKAILNEREAKKALNELSKQKEFAELVSVNSVDQLEINYTNHLKNSEFDKALDFINKTVQLYPSNKRLNAFKGEVHFYMQEFSEAETALQKAGYLKFVEPYRTMIELLPTITKTPKEYNWLTPQQLLDFTFKLNDQYRDRFISYMTSRVTPIDNYQQLYNDPLKRKFIDRHMEYCRLMSLKEISERKVNDKINQKTLEDEFKFSYELSDEGIHLDLSNGKRVENLAFIQHLPLASLNLENTFFWRKWIFNHPSLKSVNIRNTQIKKLDRQDLWNMLEEIIMTQEQYILSDKGTNAIQKRLKFIVR